MNHVQTNIASISGSTQGTGNALILDPFHLFKGKLRAAAQRSKFHDSADLRWLESRFSQQIKARSRELNLGFVGLAIKRYTELELLFDRIGVDINAAKYAARNLDPNHLPPPAQGGVQEGLFG
jgi:hypothetical protein